MKYFWLDVLIAFLIWQLSIYVYENTTPEYFLNTEVEIFNDDVRNQRTLSDYHISKETQPNKISNAVEQVSEISRKTIQIAVDLTIGMLSGFD